MKILIVLISLIAAAGLGVLAGRSLWPADTAPVAAGADRNILYWVAPMDPNYRRPAPGKSPMGMDLVPVYGGDVPDGASGTVTIAPHVVNNLGVRTAPVAHGKLSRRIQTTGYVQVNEETVHHVHTRVEGWIEQMTVRTEGERVSRGQVLFELYSPILVAAQEEYLTAVRTGNRSLIDASEHRLQSLGLSDGRLKSLRETGRAIERVPVRAGSDGIVDQLNVRVGMYVQPSTIVMSVYALDNVWLIAELFERDSSWLTTGSDATVRVDSMPAREWNGVIDYIYPDLDPVTRALRARLTLANPDEALRPNMYATVFISGAELSDALHIPREAVIRGGQGNRVVIALGDGRYRSLRVETGMETADRVQILNGLGPDDTVVVSGQFLIDSESNIAADLARIGQDGEHQ